MKKLLVLLFFVGGCHVHLHVGEKHYYGNTEGQENLLGSDSPGASFGSLRPGSDDKSR